MTCNETKFMESVIALYEELNFARAAEKIHVRQSTITKNLQKLESILGFRLFERDHQRVKATEACRAYVEKARISLLYGERALQAARAVMQESDVVLNVGRSPYTDPFLISTLLSVHPPLFPRFRIDLSSQYSCDLIHDLLAGGLDLALATEPSRSRLLTTVKVAESPFYIGMSKRDGLAKNPSVTLDAMVDRCWVIFERRLHPPLYDAVMHLAKKRRIMPSKILHVTAPEEAFPLVADGSCIAFLVKAGAVLMARNGVTIRPLQENALSLKTYLVSLADNKSKVASELVRTFMQKLSDITKANQLPLSLSA